MIDFLKGLSTETQVALLVGLGSQAFSIVVVILAHLLSVRQDRKREEAEAIKQKREFYRDRLEELYSLAFQMYDTKMKVFYNLSQLMNIGETEDLKKRIEATNARDEQIRIERIRLIVEMYFPELKESLESLYDILNSFVDMYVKRANGLCSSEWINENYGKLFDQAEMKIQAFTSDILAVDIEKLIK